MDGDLRRLLLPVLVTLGVGTYVGTKLKSEPSSSRDESASLKQLENTARVSAEAVLTQIQSFLTNTDLPYFAEIEIKAGSVVPLSQKPIEPITAQAYLRAATSRLAALGRELAPKEIIEFRVKPDAQSGAEWIGFLYGSNKRFGQISVRLVDPKKAFVSIQGISARGQGADLRSLLITEDGRVLAHSVAALAGSDFSRVPLVMRLRQMDQRSAYPSGRSDARVVSFDRLPVLAGWARVGNLPLYVINEQAVWTQPNSTRGGVSKNEWGWLAGLLFLVWGRFAWRVGRKSVPFNVMAQAPTSMPESATQALASEIQAIQPVPRSRVVSAEPKPIAAEVAPKPKAPEPPLKPQVTVAVEKAMEQSMAVQAELSRLRLELSNSKRRIDLLEQSSHVSQGIAEDLNVLSDPRAIAKRLTEGAAELCGSSALFLLFQERTQSAAVLQVCEKNPKHRGLNFQVPIEERLSARILAASAKGDIPVMREYAPIARILLAKTGSPRFEAWAVVLPGTRAKLLGFLLVLKEHENQALPLSAIHRMLKQAQARYEIALRTSSSQGLERRRVD